MIFAIQKSLEKENIAQSTFEFYSITLKLFNKDFFRIGFQGNKPQNPTQGFTAAKPRHSRVPSRFA
jgi:hypothetical protein